MDVVYDVRAGRWHCTGWGGAWALREWTWGERRRLVETCCRDDGFDDDLFTAAVPGLLYEPEPPAELAPLFTVAALDLLDLDEAPDVALDEAERMLAERFGWRPTEMDGEPARAIDRLLRELLPGSSTVSQRDDGWTTILVVEDEPDGAKGGGGRGA